MSTSFKRYVRIVSDPERVEILATGLIPLNFGNWVIYPPRTVVFLWDKSAAERHFIEQVATLNADMQGQGMWLLQFDGDIATAPDESGRAWPGAVIARAAIPLNALNGVTWTRLV